MSIYTKKQQTRTVTNSKGQGQSQKPFGLTRVRDPQNPLGSTLMVTGRGGDPIVQRSPDSLTNRKRKLLSNQILKELQKITKKKAKGGDLKTEYRAGGAVNLGNYKGQF